MEPLGTVLGMGIDPGVVAGHEAVSSGDIVFLYTDVLVERRTEAPDVGLERLRSLIDGIHDVNALSEAIVDHLIPRALGDDIAFIAARLLYVAPLPRWTSVAGATRAALQCRGW